MPSETGADLTTEHGGAVDQTVDPGGGGIILLKVQLELHEEHGNTSGYRDRGGWFFIAFLHNSLQNVTLINFLYGSLMLHKSEPILFFIFAVEMISLSGSKKTISSLS